MIGRLKGKVETIGESVCILDVGGVGYEVSCSARTLRGLEPGQDLVLTIDTHVRADAIRLYGFGNETERSWFRTLQSIQGVGAKVALNVLGVLAPHELATAIALQDWASLEQAQGVGKKLAQRIVLELKDKAPTLALAGTVVSSVTGPGVLPRDIPSDAATEALSALTNLGYNPAEANAAVLAALKDLGPEAGTAQLIRRGLKELSR